MDSHTPFLHKLLLVKGPTKFNIYKQSSTSAAIEWLDSLIGLDGVVAIVAVSWKL
jgi:hypothetical protein